MDLAKKIASGALWVGRGTATVMGLAVILALSVGLASTALAGTGIGARFHLGKTNTVDFVSTFAGSFSGPMLRIDNDLPDNPRFINSTALDLQVEPGNPPMTVNSSEKVTNLNADQLDNRDSSQFLTVFDKAADSDRLDGKDSAAFFTGKTYVVQKEILGPGGEQEVDIVVKCDQGDVVLGGGGEVFTIVNDNDLLASSPLSPVGGSGWFVTFRDNGINSESFMARAICADFPPLRP